MGNPARLAIARRRQYDYKWSLCQSVCSGGFRPSPLPPQAPQALRERLGRSADTNQGGETVWRR